MIRSTDHVLFYGDSITDCGRDRSDSDSLGNGYVQILADCLANRDSDQSPRVTNRGISGNRIYDLEARLDEDVIALEPTVVSILVGINDTWHRFNHGKESPLPDFTASYERVLTRLGAVENLRILILEPFLLPIPEDRRAWRADLDQRISIIRDLAWKHRIPYIPLDGTFAAASVATGHAHWLPDGVHPSPEGHRLIAGSWLEFADFSEKP